MKGTMRCAIFYGAKDVRMETRNIPQIGEKDVLVKVLRAGICGSDSSSFKYGGEGHGIMAGNQFGHEFVGRIVEKGSAVADDINIGDIVWVDPTRCKKAGTPMAPMCGAFSEYVDVEEAKLNYNIYQLPKDVDLDKAVLIEPAGIGAQAVVTADPKPGDKVVVLGAGAIGISVVSALVSRGVTDVVVIARHEDRLSVARKFGVKTLNTSETDLREGLVDILGTSPTFFGEAPDVDVYIDCAGAKKLIEQSISLSKLHTKYIVASTFSDDITFNGMLFMFQIKLVGVMGYVESTIHEVIDTVINDKTPIKAMMSSKYKHEDFLKAIEAAEAGRTNIKVVIDYEMK